VVKTFSGRNNVDNGRYCAGRVERISGFQASTLFSSMEFPVMEVSLVYCLAIIPVEQQAGLSYLTRLAAVDIQNFLMTGE